MSRRYGLLEVLKTFGGENNRDEYIALAFENVALDADGDLPPELEAELPPQFQRTALDENVVTRRIQ